MKLPPEESDCTSDLSQWFHCASNKGLPDTVLSQAWDIVKSVSFVFHHRSAAAEVEPDAQKVDVDKDSDAEQSSKGKSRFREDDEDEDVDVPDDDSDEDFVL